MYTSLLMTWLTALAWFDPRLARLFRDAATGYDKAVVGAFIFLLNWFWLFGIYYLYLFIFTLTEKFWAPKPQLGDAPPGVVAILYLTHNDFDEDAAASCTRQDYPCRLFILDDSTRADMMDRVDCFHRANRSTTSVIRRCSRLGFKGGNINNAVGQIDCDYFAVVDSDGVVPPNFVSSLMPYFSLDPQIAFVHGSNRPNPRQKSGFASDLALGIVPLWTTYFGPRNHFGFVPFLGHGAILRRDVWEAVGGMPEIVSEDLAFSTRAAELGFVGYFVGNVISLEDFPSTYAQLRKQQEKYVKGACEFIDCCLWSFLRSGHVRWFEKLDVVLSCATLFLPLFHALFLIVFGVLLAGAIGEPHTVGLRFGATTIAQWKAHLLKESFNALWSWDFYAITLVNMFAPVLGCAQLVFSAPKRLARLILLSSVPYLSLMIVCIFGVLTYAITRRAVFTVTADRDDAHGERSSDSNRPRLALVDSINSGHWLVHATELVLGVALAVFCLRQLNVPLFGFSLCLLMGSVLVRSGWNTGIRLAVSFPFVLIMGGMGLLGANLFTAQGALFPLMLFHF